MPDRRRVLPAVVLIAVSTGCAIPASDPTLSASPAPVTVSGASSVLADLCAAEQAADTPATAREAFARAHGPLHDLAREVQARDRAAAARLLEAKQRVEFVLDNDPRPGALTAPLRDLVETTRAGLQATGAPAPPCPPQP